jgi:hypothetical protein
MQYGRDTGQTEKATPEGGLTKRAFWEIEVEEHAVALHAQVSSDDEGAQ